MRPPIAMTIAGSDSGGGAGIQADLKTFTALGVYGTSAITALTAQNTLGVQAVIPIAAEGVRQQLTSVLDDIPHGATKIGMLASAEVIAAVAEVIESRQAQFGRIVLDPVMVATSGDILLPDRATKILRERLLPLAHVITPNLPEAARLLGEDEAEDVDAMQAQAVRLRELGAAVVLLKGGHRAGEEMIDVVAHSGGVDLLREARIHTRSTHGTGCTLSAAIAAQYARIAVAREQGTQRLGRLASTADAAFEIPGETESDDDLAAIRAGRDFLQRALLGGAEQDISLTPALGHGPVDHLLTIARHDAQG